MATLVVFLRYEIWLLLGALFLIVGYQILTRKITTTGLLLSKDPKGGVSPARVQLLMFTLTGAFYYLAQVIHDPSSGLPDPPQQLIEVLLGSNLLYMGSKGYFSFFRRGPGPTGNKNTEGGT
jgi:drug/metabolite transporter (DMT)-like permease